MGGCRGRRAAHLFVDRHLGRCGFHSKKSHNGTRNQRNNLYVYISNDEAKLKTIVTLLNELRFSLSNQVVFAIQE